jgi:hypothetical protein
MHIQGILREKKIIEFEGVTVRYAGEWQDLQPGDSYMAERNQGPQLLTVRKVEETLGDRNQWRGAVFSVEPAYAYDLGECVKVEIDI